MRTLKQYISARLSLGPIILLLLLSFSCATSHDATTNRTTPGLITLTIPDKLFVDEKNDDSAEDPDNEVSTDQKTDISMDQSSETEKEISHQKSETEARGEEDELHKEKASPPKMIGVDIFIPKKKTAGDILVLPGWRFSRKRWQKETDILNLAEKYGFSCVFPEMTVTLYESEYYNETVLKWAGTPGGTWISTILIPVLREKYGLFPKGGKNYLLGLSTGGRGVVLLSLQNPDLFTSGAALSGDYNQIAMPHDRLVSSVYGPFKKFQKRWITVDNPEQSIMTGKWEMPLYIGHGKYDRIVPFTQSQSFVDMLKKYHPKVPVIFSEPEHAGHDFKFWSGEVPAIMKFFLEHQE